MLTPHMHNSTQKAGKGHINESQSNVQNQGMLPAELMDK